MHLHAEMGVRDLLQRRSTKGRGGGAEGGAGGGGAEGGAGGGGEGSGAEVGDTVWVWSPLVEGAVKGEVVVLDGIDRLAPGVLASVQVNPWEFRKTKKHT